MSLLSVLRTLICRRHQWVNDNRKLSDRERLLLTKHDTKRSEPSKMQLKLWKHMALAGMPLDKDAIKVTSCEVIKERCRICSKRRLVLQGDVNEIVHV